MMHTVWSEVDAEQADLSGNRRKFRYAQVERDLKGTGCPLISEFAASVPKVYAQWKAGH